MSWAKKSIEDIKNLHLPHRNWNAAFAYAYAMMIASSPGEVICITGPSRAGKSELTDHLESMTVGSEEHVKDGVMSVVKILATNCSVGGTFSTKSFTLRVLDALKHPFYSDTSSNTDDTHSDEKIIDDWGADYYKQLGRTPEHVLRSALEKALIHRKTKYLFIDEAQHVLYALGGAKGAGATLNSWKCLAQSTGVVLVLVGAYPVLDAIRLCPHIIGRKHEIHLPRYRPVESDLLVFESLLDEYSKLIRLHPDVNSLRNYNQLLYEGSLGCIGLLESWLREALAIALAYEDEYFTEEHLLLARKVDEDRKMVAAEILNGECMLALESKSKLESIKLLPPAKRHGKPFVKNPRRYDVSGRQ